MHGGFQQRQPILKVYGRGVWVYTLKDIPGFTVSGSFIKTSWSWRIPITNLASKSGWHPKQGHLKVGLRNRCPEIAALDALQLIKELEEKQLEEFNSQLHEMELRLEALQCNERKSWTEHLLTFRKDGSPASCARHFAYVLLPRICLLTCLR